MGCPPRTPSLTNAAFFAAQTVTTTGYGSSIFLESEDVQSLSLWGMLVGAALWSVVTAALFSIMVKE